MFFPYAIREMTEKQMAIEDTTALSAIPEAVCAYVFSLTKKRLCGKSGGTQIESICFHRGFPKAVKERISVENLPAEGKRDAHIAFWGFSVPKHLHAMYKNRPTLDWGDEFAMG